MRGAACGAYDVSEKIYLLERNNNRSMKFTAMDAIRALCVRNVKGSYH